MTNESKTAADDEFWEGIWWVPDGTGNVRNATPKECAAEIKRLRAACLEWQRTCFEWAKQAVRQEQSAMVTPTDFVE